MRVIFIRIEMAYIAREWSPFEIMAHILECIKKELNTKQDYARWSLTGRKAYSELGITAKLSEIASDARPPVDVLAILRHLRLVVPRYQAAPYYRYVLQLGIAGLVEIASKEHVLWPARAGRELIQFLEDERELAEQGLDSRLEEQLRPAPAPLIPIR